MMSTVSNEGRITIPGQIRRHLNLKTGDRVEFFIQPDGRVELVPVNIDVRQLKGFLAPAPRRVSLKTINAAMRGRAARR